MDMSGTMVDRLRRDAQLARMHAAKAGASSSGRSLASMLLAAGGTPLVDAHVGLLLASLLVLSETRAARWELRLFSS